MTLRSATLEFFNELINDPSVRPTIEQGTHRLDATQVLSSPYTLALTDGVGVGLFLHIGDGHYEGHVYCPEGHRGAKALALGKRAITQLFASREARVLTVPVPLALPAARFYCRKLGLRASHRDLFQEYFITEASSWAA